jgi:hypothetical protein
MTAAEITSLRLSNQNISRAQFNSPGDLLSWMGAMQSQDYPMSKWAVGTRLRGSSETQVNEALDSGSVLRTHVLRPTWHLVAAENIRWMLRLTAPVIKSSAKTRYRNLELDSNLLSGCISIFIKTLENANYQTREELNALLSDHGIDLDNNRGAHILMFAELEGIICSGPRKKGKYTYALLDERAPVNDIDREDALSLLAKTYFMSHGPATVRDFGWWSGLPARDVRTAMELVKNELEKLEYDGVPYYFSGQILSAINNETYLLPSFDEFLISYTDRTASLSLLHNKKAVSNNGMFWPVIVTGGQVEGLWKRSAKKDIVVIETEFFRKTNRLKRESTVRAAEKFGDFIGKKIEVIFKNK